MAVARREMAPYAKEWEHIVAEAAAETIACAHTRAGNVIPTATMCDAAAT